MIFSGDDEAPATTARELEGSGAAAREKGMRRREVNDRGGLVFIGTVNFAVKRRIYPWRFSFELIYSTG